MKIYFSNEQISNNQHLNEGKANLIKKLLTLSFIISILGFVIVLRLYELNITNYNNQKEQKLSKTVSSSDRGFIFDRKHRILASNIFSYKLLAFPRNIDNPEQITKILKSYLPNINKNTVKKRISDKSKFEVIVAKNITAPTAKKINDIGIPGLKFKEIKKRFYPHKNLSSHVIGHTNNKSVGVYGIEKYYNNELSKGENIILSIDIAVQYAVREELKKSLQSFNAKSATAIIADIETGEILSLVSLPDFNPNISINPLQSSYRNTATFNLYEMGSTFKVFTVAAALQNSNIALTSNFDASKPLKISNFYIKDYHAENRVLSMEEIFLKSSNIGSSLIALELGENKLKNFYNKVGFLNHVNLDLSEISKPKYPINWGEIETATLSFGHGISITPMHMIQAAIKVFSQENLTKISIKKQINIKVNKTNEIISETNRNIITNLMEANVLNGTAKKAKINGYHIGGKTATAEKSNINGYDKNRLVSSFLGIFPANKPKYVSLVLFDEPSFSKNKFSLTATGGNTAAPTTANIIRRISPLVGLSKTFDKDLELLVKNRDRLNFVHY